MEEETKIEINKILNELPTENSWLDYKSRAYKKTELTELTIDLCAFLNSEQSFGKNKYIICGISNNKDRLGIEEKDMLDDHYFQDAARRIYPLPKIETGIFNHIYQGVKTTYGYILISKDNDDRIYEIETSKIKNNDNNLYTIKEIIEQNIFAPVAWIRVGSTKDILKEPTRRKIYEFDNSKKKFLVNNDIEYLLQGNKTSDNKIIKTALLFGQWNENNSYDKKIIEEYSGMSYNSFIEEFRRISKRKQDFKFKNGIWKINNRIKYTEFYSLDFYKEDFDGFSKIIIKILSEKHPKLDLPSNKRYLYNIYNKITKYSDEIRYGVSEILVIVESLKNCFENCKVIASSFVILTVRSILEKSNWYTWASLDNLLPLLAEASPAEYLNQFEQYLLRDKKKKILYENETDIITYSYSTSVYWSLELIAWNTDYCVRACMILFALSQEDEKSIDHIVNIILPWCPNTFAPFSFRLTIVENILKKDISIGWKILKKLMPGETTYAIPTYKPKYINIPNDEISVTNEEYYNQVDLYLGLMIKYCKTSNERLIDLIGLLDSVSQKNFDKICTYLKSSKILIKNDNSKYKLWDELESIAHWIKKQSDINDEIKDEMIEKINDVIFCLKPQNILYIIARLFKKDAWELIDDYDNYELLEKQLHELRFNSVRKVYIENGINSIIKLSKIVEDSYSLGIIVSKLNISNRDEESIILPNLDKSRQLIDFAKGYVYDKYNRSNIKYKDKLINNLSKKAKINFMLELPYNLSTFENVDRLLGNDWKKYWKQVDIRVINDNEILKYSIVKLMSVKRYESVLRIYRLSKSNDENMKYDNGIILTCLEKIKKNFNQYDICMAIKKLQSNNADTNRLFFVEWKFLALLSHDGYRPITIEKRVSSDANCFCEILELVFKEQSKNKDSCDVNSELAKNAYRLLHQWKLVPGTTVDGYIDSNQLRKWYEDMKKVCKEKDRLEVALTYFGKVLFYSPKDKTGFWIDKSVAEILNENETIREGYRMKAFNSVGVVRWDKEYSDYNKKRNEYKEKARDTELAGYYNFAAILRNIANDFEFYEEQMRDTFSDF